jgi:ribonuclease P protein component
MARYTLKKKEILSGQIEINEVFNSGKTLFVYPLKVFYNQKENVITNDSQVLFSVSIPKKIFKKAVNRNLLKRRIREAYRLNKLFLTNDINNGIKFSFMLVYVGKKIESFSKIEKSVIQIIRLFKEKIDYEK